jgi:hypothetical protein
LKRRQVIATRRGDIPAQLRLERVNARRYGKILQRRLATLSAGREAATAVSDVARMHF